MLEETPDPKMDFIEMWKEANFVDASIGGIDSIPEEEYHDYVEACLMALSDDFKNGRAMKLKATSKEVESESSCKLGYYR